MFLDDPKSRKTLTQWAVGTVAACILIFLGVRYISAIAIALGWLYDLVKPLLIGTLLAMILSVPLDFIEKHSHPDGKPDHEQPASRSQNCQK